MLVIKVPGVRSKLMVSVDGHKQQNFKDVLKLQIVKEEISKLVREKVVQKEKLVPVGITVNL
jgi:hypothetical protein